MRKQVLVLVCLLPFLQTLHAQDTIAPADLNTAARLFDMHFTQPEIDSMYDGVKDTQDKLHRYFHKKYLPNNVPMSLWQNPATTAAAANADTAINQWPIPAGVQLPANKNELAFYSIPQLASLIKYKKISSVELTRFFINRIKQYGDSLHCLISLTEDIAMQQAQQADAEIAAGKYRGPLHGIPYGLKDLFAVKGTKTTWGAAPFKDQVIEEDAYVYTRLRNAGAVLVAKLTLGALAMGDKWYGGKTRNPWNLENGSSGSSAGSAAATVAGLLPFAIGTETWGSIISPASTCGATGLRPTFGSISRTGAMALSWSLDKIGPLCRSAADAAIVFDYIRGTDGKDLSAATHTFHFKSKTDIHTLKIAYARNYFRRLRDSSNNEFAVLETFRKMGAELIPIDFPDSGIYVKPTMPIIIGAESAAAFDELTRTNLDDQLTYQTKDDWPNNFRTSRFISAADYVNACRQRFVLQQRVNAVLSQYDAVICPNWAGNESAITNLTGNPAICFPTGFNAQKLPTSISLIGKLNGEAALLQLVNLYQQATSWNKQHPALFQ
ncbi:amidase [Deminuibacter soli]|uniref:Amidase n=1 Tax=Deminuibacter soli TaxID=2291815 RepID=A0A3E1NR02_9BACT|nr:amidase [Deminuibacter soli]RFM30361.1 amidase [Deminuibacter soli]